MSKNEWSTIVDDLALGVVREQAPIVDAERSFPQASIDAFLATKLAGLISATQVGGLGQGPRAAVDVVERLARVCGSTAMVVTMHYAGTAVIEKLGSEAVRRQIARGEHLSTLAFSERGSRSHFWAPVGGAERTGAGVALSADKSFVTSANHATAYVWSSKPLAADGASTLWLVPREAGGLAIEGRFDGIGLRGNDSAPVSAKGVVVDEGSRLGADGAGLETMLGTVLPIFSLMTAAVALGLTEAATSATIAHAKGTHFEHLERGALCELPTVRAYIARMRCRVDMARALLDDAVSAVESGREDALLRVLESKAVCGEAATEICDLAMRVCGGAAFRRDLGIERNFRDARACTVMAPTTDQLYDFIGKAVCGMDVF